MFRVCSSKENMGLFRGLFRFVSVLEFDKVYLKKVKRYNSGLRRVVSNINFGLSRNFVLRIS